MFYNTYYYCKDINIFVEFTITFKNLDIEILLNNQNVINSQLKSTGVVEIPMNPVVAVISYILPHKLEH